ncbi:ABC transporter substrate-binding protein [Acinetobacter johnsonii]|uniref:ABC transporter substrate-binding protein n=1 Tax=Acinetobacter johnsonii TaxID=40214 RepID=A0AAW6RPF0_ACIJO|nr:ABC transporter substrate-binding protein [Acinetobacter johnsonii]MDG9785518.1 ABC transporter substrate-binding protein [Acinetobacter johnsonii]MDG9800408.1 ABC transporter substrate-binding protein [Acinetobacter johnsonii]MDH0712657.1 ABC transporter substrate-binding protein [Acinetobacter johnsonii]MDH1069915.1 ABC transporter substrate-binding protein [Acinetobacter johnsonii]
MRNLNQKLKRWGLGILAGSILLSSSVSSFAQSPADPKKVLRYVFPVAETGFDPAGVHDLYSAHVNGSIFETLFTYDYLASPAKLVPRTAAALPEVSADGLTYTIRLQKGIYFAVDPVFKGKKRELTSTDYVYTFKRLLDPSLRSPNSWLLDGRILGMDTLLKQAQKTGKFNYDQSVAGLQTPDRYTLVIRLTSPDQNFPMLLAHQPAGAVAREVIEKYRDKAGFVMGHPIGTGPYMLSRWTPGSRIILKANPDFRSFVWNFKASTPEDQKIVKAMQGKKMPQIGEIDIQVMEEGQSRWLSFIKDEVDLFALDGELTVQALQDGKLKPELVKKGVQLSRITDPSIDYHYWNMQNPIVGGLSKDKIALRRAMAMAFSADNYINILQKGDSQKLQAPIPSGVVGYDPNYRSSIPYSVKAANLLLDRYHYKVAADGWRTQPNGKPLVIEMTLSGNNLRSQQQAEFWKKTLDSIKIKMTTKSMPFAEALKLEKQCKTMFKASAWIADYPDADNFMQLFYGKNIKITNNGCVKIPEYDRLYEQAQKMTPSPERDAIYAKMSRLLEVYMPVQVIGARYRNILAQPRVIGFKKHPILPAEWMYIDIDLKK